MPRATLDLNDTKRFELQSLPEGFVVLKRMSYGQKLQRQQMAMSMAMRGSSAESFEGLMEVAQVAVAEFEFKVCIVEHNLQDSADNLLDFKNSAAVQSLDPRIGDEIGKYIDSMNTFEASAEGKN